MSAPSELCSIAYVSSATQLFDAAELEALLVDARQFNLEHGVTGVLLYGDGNFMQYFEGSDQGVQAAYERIRASRRHVNIIELLNEPVARRSFADWQMGFVRPTESELVALSTASWRKAAAQAADSADMSPGLALLLDFWRNAGG